MGSGTSTTEDEGRLGDTHEESKFVSLSSIQCVPAWFFETPLTASGIRKQRLGYQKALRDQVYPTSPHCELTMCGFSAHK